MENNRPLNNLSSRNRRTVLIVLAVAVTMIGASYAFVPLYALFCRVTGFGGTTQVAAQAPPVKDILKRTIIVKFDANTARDIPWHFTPEMRETKIQLGKKGLASFRAQNTSDEAITGTAVYNVTPDKAGKYFHKIQCFCFGEQTLAPGKSISMPVVFYVDPALDRDQNMADVTHITLSYTFFKTGSSDLDKAVEGFYNQASTKSGNGPGKRGAVQPTKTVK